MTASVSSPDELGKQPLNTRISRRTAIFGGITGVAVVASLGVFAVYSGGGLTFGSKKPKLAPVVALDRVKVVGSSKIIGVVSVTNPTDKQVIFSRLASNIFGRYRMEMLIPENVHTQPPDCNPFNVCGPDGKPKDYTIHGAVNGFSPPRVDRTVVDPGKTELVEFEFEILKDVSKWLGRLERGVIVDAADTYPADELKTVTSWIFQGIAIFETGECVIIQGTPEEHVERLTKLCKEYR